MCLLKNYCSFFFLLFIFFCNSTLLAQQNASDTVNAPAIPIKYWDTKGSFALNFSQVSLNNWAGGGESSISIGSHIHLFADYSKGNAIWENRMQMAYGLIRQGDAGETGFRKTDDQLIVTSKYNYHLEEGYFVTAIADYRTQMGVGYDYRQQNDQTIRQRRSDFMAPGFLVSSLGVTFKRPKIYSVTLSPFTGKFTFVLDDSLSRAGAFGVDPGQRIRSEAGAALNSHFEKEIFTNITLRTNLNLFAGYDDFTRVDINWDGTLLLKVNQYIKSTIAAQLIYDHDIIQKIQWRNVINVGFLLEI